jgi:hypothetical protein
VTHRAVRHVVMFAGILAASSPTHLLTAASSKAQSSAAPLDIAAVDNGGRIEAVTSVVQGYPEWAPINLIAKTAFPGWSAENPTLPQEIVFSFLTEQSALIDTVVINPDVGVEAKVAAKDVEIWVSPQSSTDGFVRVATSSLKAENVDQPIPFTPRDARYVKLRLLTAHDRLLNGQPEPAPVSVRRVRILEAQRAGYVPLLARNPELAALAKGVIPSAPPDAVVPLPKDGLSSCLATPPTKTPSHPESRHVLVIARDPNDYTPTRLKLTTNAGSPVKPVDYSIYGRIRFVHVTPETASPAHLLRTVGIDTVAISQVCDAAESLSPAFKQSLLAWIAAGHKLIIHDADGCGGTTIPDHPNRAPDYSWLPFRMKTVNPGKAGLRGVASVMENSTLASGLATDPSYLPMTAWVKDEEGNGNELGDSNVIVEHDPHWCGQIFGKNGLQKSGFIEAYARFGHGLIIYNGIDLEQIGSPAYNQLVTRELAQPFNPDNLPCSQPLGGFIITTNSEMKSLPMVHGRTYTYPLSVLGNFGYTGRVALDASVVPADPGMTVTLDRSTADLTNAAESATSLAVTATSTASLKSKIVAVRGRDTTGKSNVLCLNLPERTTGGLSVVSALRRDRPPTKNLEIILDASGSMKAALGKRTRWATAQSVLRDVVNKLPPDFSVGLRAYGHTLASTDPGTCTDSELVVPVGPLDRPALLAAAERLAPRGETPLVYSVLQTRADLEPVGDGTVVLITDGEESCKGDFATAAKALKDSGLKVTLNIVGFTLKSAAAQTALGGLAESTGGHYYTASNGDALTRAVLLAALDRLPYRVLDAAGKEAARGEAGVDAPHELAPGNYTVVITAAERDVRTPVALAVGQDITLRAQVKGDTLVVER